MLYRVFTAARPGVFAGAILFIAASVSADTTKSVNVPAQALQTAIATLGAQTNVEVVASAESLEGKISPAVRGTMTPISALEQVVHRVIVFAQRGHAEARGDVERLRAPADFGAGEISPEQPCGLLCLGNVGMGQRQGKLLTSDPTKDRAFAQARLQHFREHQQRAIAGAVTMQIVGLFEDVHVGDDARQRSGRLRPRDPHVSEAHGGRHGCKSQLEAPAPEA